MAPAVLQLPRCTDMPTSARLSPAARRASARRSSPGWRRTGRASSSPGATRRAATAVAQRTGARFVRADARDPAAVARLGRGRRRAPRRPRDRRSQRRRAVRGARSRRPRTSSGTRVIVDEPRRPFRYAREVLPALRETRGSMVLVASDAGVWGETPIAAYSVSKRAVIMLTRMLAVEAGPDGVRVNAVCPGDTEPGMVTTVAGRETLPDTRGVDAPAARAARARPRRRGGRLVPGERRGAHDHRRGPADRRRHARRAAREHRRRGARAMSRSALVTGGTGGIGSAIVRRLRADGYEVVFCGRDEQRARGAGARDRRRVLPRPTRPTARPAMPRSHSRWSGSAASICSSANAGILGRGPARRHDGRGVRAARRDEPHLDVPLRARAVRADAPCRAAASWC